jgi:20S proteasome alpha/beta subunit
VTLIVALRGKDGLVLAGDSRGTVGDPRGLTAINDDQTKLFELSTYCGVGLSGASELAAKVIDDLRVALATSGSLEYADHILNQARGLVRSSYDDWFTKFPLEQRPSLLFTLVGFHRDQAGELTPRTYLLASQLDFAPQLFPTGNCLTGVPQYAVYLMHRFYSPEMTVDNLARLAAYLISETATQDPKVGGPIHIATLTSDEGFKLLDDGKVEEINRLNAEQNENLKRSFLG